MNTVTQKMMFRQSLINYAEKKGVTKAAIKYDVSQQYVYRWMKRYDGTLQSLADKSHRPLHHPNQHTDDICILNFSHSFLLIAISPSSYSLC